MKVGDIVTATWPDGLQVVGRYARTERGYIILIDEEARVEIPCRAQGVHFETGNHMPKVPSRPIIATKSSWASITYSFVIGVVFGIFFASLVGVFI